MDCPPMETVYQAISALYDNPNASEKEKASLWLGDVQKSIHSWKIADELLQQKKDIHSCYFAAQTMRSKVQHNLSELPQEAHNSLRDSLVSHLEQTSPESSSAILTQLSLALADLALQMPSWQHCINDLIKSFSNKNDYALLEILTVLPQEIDSTSLKLGENRREDIKNELHSNAQIVTLFLKESITCSENVNVLNRVVKCMTSWLQVRVIDIQEIPQNAVICFCLQILRDHNSANMLHDSACDCICALLHCLEENNNNDNIERLLFDSISSLEESYHMAVAHEQEDKAANYARVFTELAETFLEKIISCTASGNTHFAIRSLELALMCIGHYDYEVAEITFNLWYRLSEEVYQRDYQPLTDTFKPHIERLLEALVRQCQFEPDVTNLPEEGDEFYEFRSKVMVLIKDVVFIVGSSSVFRQMFVALHADISWEQTEAALFIMRAVAKNILPDEYEYVPKVVEAILSMPATTHPGVRKTCIRLLGELCEWIERHHECLEPCLQFLINALREPYISHVAAVALQDICRACRSHASEHVSALAAAARDSHSLPAHTAGMLVRALAAALGRLPADQVRVTMREAVGMQLAGLSAAVAGAGDGPPGKKGSPSDPVLWLDRIAALFRDVEVPAPDAPGTEHPCLPAFADTWPVLKNLINKWSGETRVMERACRCVRFAVRCLGASAAPLAPDLCATLQRAYRTRACSCVLYLCSVLVDELAVADGAVPLLLDLLQALVPAALHLLQQPGALVENPDTVDDLFRLCIRYLQRMPAGFVRGGAASGALQCARLAARLDHADANSSVMKFLYDFLRLANVARDDKRHLREAARELVLQHGAELAFALLEASALRLHAHMLDEVAEALHELVLFQREGGAPSDWLQEALQRLPRDRPATATSHQCWQFHQYLLRAEKCKEITRLLRDFSKLYR